MSSSSVALLPFLLLVSTIAVSDGLAHRDKTIFCHKIKNGSSDQFNLWKNCEYAAGKGIGNFKEFIVLDFSTASQNEIQTFFEKPGEENFTLSAGIRLYRNDYVKIFDFGNLGKIRIPDILSYPKELFVFIGNYHLNRIEAPHLRKIKVSNLFRHARFINNPVLMWEKSYLFEWITKLEAERRIYWTKSGVCQFIFPGKTGKPFELEKVPLEDKFGHCTTIQGDLILENGRMHGATVKGGCLRLKNVDFDENWIGGNGHLNCLDGKKSQLIDNPNLCGDRMRQLVNVIQNETVLDSHAMEHGGDTKDIDFDIRLDQRTCARDCTKKEALNPYYLCRMIKEKVPSISSWFLFKEGFAQKINFLQSSKNLAIGNTNLTVVKMPNLKIVGDLIIYGNSKLASIEMPSLKKIGTFYFLDNPMIKLSTFSKIFKKIDEIGRQSRIHCHPDEIITDLRKLKLCTHVIGDLTLMNVDNSYENLLTILELQGCLTVRNTNLTSLYFLEKTKFTNCPRQNLIENNPKLCAGGYLIGKGNVIKKNNRQQECPCIQDELSKTASTAPSCNWTHVYKEFDCNLYTADHLVEVRGTLILKNCPNLKENFPKLKKIVTEDWDAGLIVTGSSGLPSIQFLKNIEITHSAKREKDPPPVDFAIETKMSIEEYLLYKYSFDSRIRLAKPVASGEICYNLEDIRGCKIFSGDLVVRNDELNETTSIETITGCLIVQHGSQLNFLNELKNVGKSCLYGDKGKYPLSPSRGFLTTKISEMTEKYCPTREERERLAEVLEIDMIELNGEANSCSKSCRKMTQGNCDTFHGNLILQPGDHVTNLEVIYGSFTIGGTQKELLEFPKLIRIVSPTAPALSVYNNPELEFLQMPKLVNLTVTSNQTQLISVTNNPKLQNLSDFIPKNLLESCRNEEDAICYVNNLEEKTTSVNNDKNWVRDIKILAAFLALMFGVPVVYHFLTFEERVVEFEKKQRRREERRRQRRKAAKRQKETDAPQTAPTSPRKTSRIAASLESTILPPSTTTTTTATGSQTTVTAMPSTSTFSTSRKQMPSS